MVTKTQRTLQAHWTVTLGGKREVAACLADLLYIGTVKRLRCEIVGTGKCQFPSTELYKLNFSSTGTQYLTIVVKKVGCK